VMIVGAGYSFDWSLVQPEVAKFTRVCTYDSSGSAWSDPGPTPSNCQGRIEEIHTMLHNAGITSPLILVGHSVGAAFARLYTARYRQEVEGMVIGDHGGRYRGTSPPAGMIRSEADTIKRLPPLAQDMHRWAAARDGAANNTQLLGQCIAEAVTTTRTSPD